MVFPAWSYPPGASAVSASDRAGAMPLVCTAPASQLLPAALAYPRWSAAGHNATLLPPRVTVAGSGMIPITALPAAGAIVCVGPPLLASELSPSPAGEVTSVGLGEPKHELSLPALYPPSV